jgi:hypothetical protein
VKKLLGLVSLSVIAVLMFASVASAQCADYGCGGETAGQYTTPTGTPPGRTIMETTMVNGSPIPVPTPPTGGPAIVLPAASLLLGSGILTYAVLRRR